MNAESLELNLKRLRGVSNFRIMDFDTDILLQIFSRLPFNSIIRCKRVCKEWHKILTSPNFTRSYEKNPPFRTSLLLRIGCPSDHRIADLLEISENGDCYMTSITPKLFPDHVKEAPKLVFAGSCNGLMCVLLPKENWEFYIINPIRGEFIEIPRPVKENSSYFGPGHYRFGFCPSSNTFKVLRQSDWCMMFGYNYDIFTVGCDDKWRRLGEPDLSILFENDDSNVFLNGAFHSLTQQNHDPSECYIYTFHIGEEKEGRISYPLGEALNNRMDLGSLNYQLCLVDHNSTEISLWIMEDYGVEESWTKQIILRSWFPPNFGSGQRFFPVERLPNGEIIFTAWYRRYIISCDPKQKKCAIIKEFTGDDRFHPRKYSYSPCFAPLKEVMNASTNELHVKKCICSFS